ncbi:MAG TPA: histidine phosphatase family protein [Candidatus Limnocylindria bacterium]
MTSRLLLVRHGVTAWNREGRFQGHRDPELSRQGHREARLLAQRIHREEVPPSLVVTSSLARARQTAGAIAERLAIPVFADPRLMEIGQGEWEGRTHAELAVQDAERYAAWRSRAIEEPPGAEPLDQVGERVDAALRDIRERSEGSICVVSHGGTLRIAARQLFDLSALTTWRMDLDNCSLSTAVEEDGGWLLERWNDTAHLLGRTAQHVDEAEGEPLAL